MRDVVARFVDLFHVENVRWSTQMAIARNLLKTYTEEEIMYALGYYSRKGVPMYTLGYLSKRTMDKPIKEYRATQSITTWSDDSGIRNRRKFAENSKTRSGKEYYLDLFKEPRKGD